MTDRPMRLRRCQLAVPGSNPRMLEKAAGLGVDHVFLDLEDAVAPNAKAEARGNIVSALNTHDWGRATRCVRINDVGSPFCHDDIIEVVTGAGANLDTIMLPKAMHAADVQFADTLLAQLEAKLGLERPIGLEVLIEEVEGILRIDEIAAACPRLEALIFGMGDYAASQRMVTEYIGASDRYPGDIWHYQRQRVVVAARANGLDAVDGPFVNFRDADRFAEECRRAMILGFDGKWAIHPSQVPIATETFTPPQAEVDQARVIVEAMDEAMARGDGAVQIEGMMVDIASARIARNLLARADLIGM